MKEKSKKNYNLIETLLNRTGHYIGSGFNHENKEFRGELDLGAIVNKKGINIRYTILGTRGNEFNKEDSLYNIDTILHIEEHTIIAYDSRNHLALWTLSTNINTFVKFELRRYKQISAEHHIYIFGFGNPDKTNVYREEITIELHEDGDLSYSYAWGEPKGHFISRYSVKMKRVH